MRMTLPGGVWFEVSLDEHGNARSAYVRLVPRAEVARTTEVVANALLADFDAANTLVGLEILSPVPVATIQQLLDDPVVGESIARRVPDLVQRAA